MGILSKRAPWPGDVKIARNVYMLGTENPQQGQKVLKATRPQDLSSVVPTVATPSALNPVFGADLIFDDWSGGYGQRIQPTPQRRYGVTTDARYYDALGVDASHSRGACLGPKIVSLTPAPTVGGITDFFEIGGHIYALAGRFALLRTSDVDWNTSAQDFGVGKSALTAITFSSNSAAVRTVYIAMGVSEKIWTFTGASATTVWAQPADAIYATAWTTEGRNLWRANENNAITKCDFDGDPSTLANWSSANAYTISDKSSGIVSLATTPGGAVLVFKTDGIYTLDSEGQDYNLFPDVPFSVEADNGKYVSHWNTNLYFTMGRGFRRLRSDFVIEQIGPEKMTEYDGVVRGYITATCADDYYLYCGLYNTDTGNSYLMKFGAWTTDAAGNPIHIDAWHGSITAAFTTDKITKLYRGIASAHGAPSGHSRMFIGMSSGNIHCFDLPCSPNPVACTHVSFATSGTITMPLLHFGFPSDNKAVTQFAVGGTPLDSADYVTLEYRDSPTTAWTTLKDDAAATVHFDSVPVETAETPAGTTVKYLDLRLTLNGAAGASTPMMSYVAAHYAIRTRLQLVYEMYVIAADNQVKRDGSRLRLSAQDIKDNLQGLMTQTAVTTALPDETVQDLMYIGYEETMVWTGTKSKFQSGIKLTAAQFSVNVAITPGMYGAAERYSYGFLEGLTYGEIERIP